MISSKGVKGRKRKIKRSRKRGREPVQRGVYPLVIPFAKAGQLEFISVFFYFILFDFLCWFLYMFVSYLCIKYCPFCCSGIVVFFTTPFVEKQSLIWIKYETTLFNRVKCIYFISFHLLCSLSLKLFYSLHLSNANTYKCMPVSVFRFFPYEIIFNFNILTHTHIRDRHSYDQ